MIKAKNLSFAYGHSDNPTVQRANFAVAAGEICLIIGSTGSGKSTLLKMLNGLIPHYSSGTISGQLSVVGRESIGSKPHDLAPFVGYVNQQPESSFVAGVVEDELSFGLEQLGFDREAMKVQVAEITAQFGLTGLIDREISSLSGGEQQKLAIASALVGGQQILLLDEPTSALDEPSAVAVLALLKTLAKSQGITILIAEHRYERVLPVADSVITLERGGRVTYDRLTTSSRQSLLEGANYKKRNDSISAGQVRFSKSDIRIKFGNRVLIQNASIDLHKNEICAITGPNGSGKSSLLWHLAGDKPDLSQVALVPQIATDLLFLSSLRQELQESDTYSQVESGTTGKLFESLVGRIDPSVHPRDLSTGQQLALVLAMQLNKNAPVVLLDEPTRGLDHQARTELAQQLLRLRSQGKSILITSHDLDFVKSIADRTLEIRNQELVEAVK